MESALKRDIIEEASRTSSGGLLAFLGCFLKNEVTGKLHVEEA
jgi:hypothetical protein